MIKDRYGYALKKADKKPTVTQSINSWDLVNELIEIGYPHNFQHERTDIADYMFKVSGIIDKAFEIKAGGKDE